MAPSPPPPEQIYQNLRIAGYLPNWFPDLELEPNDEDSLLNRFEGITVAQHLRLSTSDDDRFKCSIGELNYSKNRYIDILPFDYNQISLSNNNYINASEISTPCGSKRYIAAQGPLQETIPDFWEMVWESQVPLIVMLTNECEGTKIKCHKYWPSLNGKLSFENGIMVDGIEESLLKQRLLERTFVVQREGETRIIKMIHGLDWPDHGQIDPRSLLDIIDFANNRLKNNPTGLPIIHCSAGVGRTGTFCTIDSVIHYIEQNMDFNMKTVEKNEMNLIHDDLITLMVNHFRKQRVYSVQNANQFKLCYWTILLRLHDWYHQGRSAPWVT